MKKNITKILLIIICVIILALIIFIVVDKHSTNNTEYNIKKGDILKFEDNIQIKVLKVSSTIKDNNKYNLSGEIEVSLKVNNDGEISNYTLSSITNNKERIINSNYYITLDYSDNKIEIDVKDKSEI